MKKTEELNNILNRLDILKNNLQQFKHKFYNDIVNIMGDLEILRIEIISIKKKYEEGKNE